MTPERKAYSRAMLLSLLGGAYAGALVVALTTPASGKEARAGLKALGNRILGRLEAEDPATAGPVKMLFI